MDNRCGGGILFIRSRCRRSDHSFQSSLQKHVQIHFRPCDDYPMLKTTTNITEVRELSVQSQFTVFRPCADFRLPFVKFSFFRKKHQILKNTKVNSLEYIVYQPLKLVLTFTSTRVAQPKQFPLSFVFFRNFQHSDLLQILIAEESNRVMVFCWCVRVQGTWIGSMMPWRSFRTVHRERFVQIDSNFVVCG